MPVPPRLTLAKPRIVAHFDGLTQSAFTTTEIAHVLEENREDWRLAQRTTVVKFIEYLTKHSKLRNIEFSCEHHPSLHRFAWGDATPLQLGLSLKTDAYLSHGTAVYLHQLNDLLPRTIYVNNEHSPGGRYDDEMEQADLDRAFSRPQRTSNYRYRFGEYTYVLVNSQKTDHLGVETIQGPDSETLPVTSLERTLIDIVVRPAYSGGIYQVAEAYASAINDLSVSRIVAMLRKLDYLYPYHQAIGYLLERAGMPAKRLSRLLELGLSYDFYLTHEMEDTDYSATWKVHYPRGF